MDVAIGLLFIFLLYSLLATSIQEASATIMHQRANTLYKGIRSMLTNTRRSKGPLADLGWYLILYVWEDLYAWMNRLIGKNQNYSLYNNFYQHPIIKNYGQSQLFKKPSYLSAENFATILIETLKDLDGSNRNKTATFAMLVAVMDTKRRLIESETHSIITFHLNEATGDIDVLKFRLAKWYNDTMDRVSGWYKRGTQFKLFFIGIAMAITLNIDTIEIADYLSENKTARAQLAEMGVAAAGKAELKGTDSIAKEVMDSIKADLKAVNTLVGLGWGDYGRSDTAFMKYALNIKHWRDRYKAYMANVGTTTKIYDSLLADVTQKRDATVAGSPDCFRFTKLVDSLSAHKVANINQQAFAMLYGNDDFNNGLKRSYVLGFRLWTYRKWIGFLITAFAIGMGAPFWFDLLNKFVSLRSSVKSVNSSGSTTRNNDAGNNSELDG
jgi:hypothetical protein